MPTHGLLACRAKTVEHAWVLGARHMKPSGFRIWLMHTTALGASAGRRRLDIVIYGVTA